MAVNIREGMRFGVGIDSLTQERPRIGHRLRRRIHGGRRAAFVTHDQTDRDPGGPRESLNISVGASVQYGLAINSMRRCNSRNPKR